MKIGILIILVLVGAVAFWGLKYSFSFGNREIFSGINYETSPVNAVPVPVEIKNAAQTLKSTPTISQTNVLARNFVDIYLQAREQNPGQEIPEKDRRAIAESLTAASQEKYLQLINPYIIEDLHIQAVETTDRLVTYFTAFGEIFSQTFPQESNAEDGPKELLIFLSAIKNNDLAQLNTLTEYINRYDDTAQKLVAIPVPAAFEKFHLASINTFSNTAIALSYMQNYENDPVGALFGMDHFNNEALSFIFLLSEVRDILNTLQLPFVENGHGDLFERYLQTI